MALIAGIDPGKNGAISIIDTEAHTLRSFEMPMYAIKKKTKTVWEPNPAGMGDILEDVTHAYIEHVQYIQGDGGQGSFSFGMNFGMLLGVLGGVRIPHTKVRPAVWKRIMGCTADKDTSLKRATELFPQCRSFWTRAGKKAYNDGVAESALIALYGMSDQRMAVHRSITPKGTVVCR